MLKKIIFTLITLIICGLCGCANEGVEKLPSQPETEVSHNVTSGMEIRLPNVNLPELDKNFADKYINTDSFEKGKNEAVNGVENTRKYYEQTEKQTIQTQNKVKSKYNEKTNTAETDMDGIKRDAEQKINDIVKSKSGEIQKNKLTTEVMDETGK